MISAGTPTPSTAATANQTNHRQRRSTTTSTRTITTNTKTVPIGHLLCLSPNANKKRHTLQPTTTSLFVQRTKPPSGRTAPDRRDKSLRLPLQETAPQDASPPNTTHTPPATPH